jgi:hypothetical protein
LLDTDVVIYTTVIDDPEYCSGSTLAAAIHCNVDRFDRPTAGFIYFCPSSLSTSAEDLSKQVMIAVHELSHVLGFSSYHFPYYRFPDGTPRTPRKGGGNFGDVLPTQQYRCVDGTKRTAVVPNENTLKRFVDAHGSEGFMITLPRVTQLARNQFDCQRIEGAPIENSPTSSSSCFGDHWEEAVFMHNSMSAIQNSGKNYFSPLTLGLFEESGWYSPVNFDQAVTSPWGLAAGCNFFNERCGGEDHSKSGNSHFCSNTEGQIDGCTGDLENPGYCLERQEGDSGFFAQLGGTCGVMVAFSNLRCGLGEKCWVEGDAGRCHATRCNIDRGTVSFWNNGGWRECEQGKDKVGDVTCPARARLCPGPFGCLNLCEGLGVCNYEEGGVCECFEDASEVEEKLGEEDGQAVAKDGFFFKRGCRGSERLGAIDLGEEGGGRGFFGKLAEDIGGFMGNEKNVIGLGFVLLLLSLLKYCAMSCWSSCEKSMGCDQ